LGKWSGQYLESAPRCFPWVRGKTAKKYGTQEKKPMRKFAAESNLMLSNVESMEVEQSVKNAE
jgi:hypothetical protein